jgi:hypothetical protein
MTDMDMEKLKINSKKFYEGYNRGAAKIKPSATPALDKSKHICTWCDGVIESDQPSVPDITSNDGERQHLGCAVEEADDCGFDGFTQDQG